jgi:hypothetical protein
LNELLGTPGMPAEPQHQQSFPKPKPDCLSAPDEPSVGDADEGRNGESIRKPVNVLSVTKPECVTRQLCSAR